MSHNYITKGTGDSPFSPTQYICKTCGVSRGLAESQGWGCKDGLPSPSSSDGISFTPADWALDPYYTATRVKNEVAEFLPTIWYSRDAQHIFHVMAHNPVLKGTVVVRVVYTGPAAHGGELMASISFDASGKISECMLFCPDVKIHGHMSAHMGAEVSVMYSGSFPNNCRAYVDYEYEAKPTETSKVPEVSDKLPDSIHNTRREVE